MKTWLNSIVVLNCIYYHYHIHIYKFIYIFAKILLNPNNPFKLLKIFIYSSSDFTILIIVIVIKTRKEDHRKHFFFLIKANQSFYRV